MASSGGGDVPAERAAVAVNDLIEVREDAARLKSLLQEQSSPWAELMDGMLDKLSSALSALDTGAGAAAAAAAGGQSSAAGSDGVRQSVTSSSRNITRKRSFSRRSQLSSSKRVTATLDDGHIWRKYGQKVIQNLPHPRSYYRCTHKSFQGCNAKRHVQVCDTDPSKYVVTYYGKHTCRDPSTIPMVIDAMPGAASDRTNNLISFAPSYANATTGGGGAPSQLVTTQLSSSWCTSDDVFSSSAEPFVLVDELAAVVGSAGTTSSTVGSAPDNGGIGDMARGGGTVSFPSSPSSLGFGDDLFRFDP